MDELCKHLCIQWNIPEEVLGLSSMVQLVREGQGENRQAERDLKPATLRTSPDLAGKEGLGDHAGQSEPRTARTRRIQGSTVWLLLLGARTTCFHGFEVTKPTPREMVVEEIWEEGAV